MSRRWQYKVMDIKPRFLGVKPQQIESALAQLGLQGWELVSAVQVGVALRLFLKREA